MINKKLMMKVIIIYLNSFKKLLNKKNKIKIIIKILILLLYINCGETPVNYIFYFLLIKVIK